jgi:hypothetical protein
MMAVNNRNVRLNQYAMELRRSGKLLREIGEELGVGKERARVRVVMGEIFEKLCERDKNAKNNGRSVSISAAQKCNQRYPR